MLWTKNVTARIADIALMTGKFFQTAVFQFLQGNRMKKQKKYVIIDQKEMVNYEKIF